MARSDHPQPKPTRKKKATAGRKPLWQKIVERAEAIPAEEWANMPHDGSINVDHYLYGVPKREP